MTKLQLKEGQGGKLCLEKRRYLLQDPSPTRDRQCLEDRVCWAWSSCQSRHDCSPSTSGQVTDEPRQRWNQYKRRWAVWYAASSDRKLAWPIKEGDSPTNLHSFDGLNTEMGSLCVLKYTNPAVYHLADGTHSFGAAHSRRNRRWHHLPDLLLICRNPSIIFCRQSKTKPRSGQRLKCRPKLPYCK